jgi:hypothetical protein
MDLRRLAYALALAPLAASFAAFITWLALLLPTATASSSDSSYTSGFGGFVEFLVAFIGYGFIIAAVAELVLGLPLFLLFWALGRIGIVQIVLAAALVALGVYLAFQGPTWPQHVQGAVIIAVPSLVGAFTFAYVSGWSPNHSLHRTAALRASAGELKIR